MSFFVLNLLNGIQLSMLIFLLAVGLTIIFGLMDNLNLAHGGFYTIGAYAGLEASRATGSFWLALLIGPIVAAVLGAALELFVQRPLVNRGRSSHLDIALLTYGLFFVIIGVVEATFGNGYEAIALPPALEGGFPLMGVTYPYYRLFIIGVGALVGLGLWFAIERTVFGAIVRAGVDNREMVLAMGININLVFAAVFGIGSALAGLAGVIAAPTLSVYSRMGVNILIVTFIVVVIGGLGNFKGSFYGSLLVGMVDTFSQAYLPETELFAVYVVLAGIMTLRPQGIFGTKGRAE
jgi:branched-chain amino acid transport system permease protein